MDKDTEYGPEPLDFTGLTNFDRYPAAVKDKLLADLGAEKVPRIAEHNELYKAFLTSPTAYLAELDRLMCERADDYLAGQPAEKAASGRPDRRLPDMERSRFALRSRV